MAFTRPKAAQIDFDATNISDSLLTINNGASSNTNDLGFIFERGSTGDNAAIIWDESADVFVLGTTTATGDSTGNLTVTAGALSIGSLTLGGTAVTSNATELNYLDGITGITLGNAGETVLVGTDGTSLASTTLLAYDTGNNRVGIGTTTPAVKFHIAGNGVNEGQIRLQQANNASGDGPDFAFYASRGTIASPSATQNNDVQGRINAYVYTGSAYVQSGSFGWSSDGTDGDNDFTLSTRVATSLGVRLGITNTGALQFNSAYTFPTADGSANQFLQTDGSGALSFATVTSSFTLAADSGSNDSFSTGQTLTIAGGTGIDTTVSDNNISIAIDSTVATLTGSQTLTNKTLTSPTINAFSGTGNGSITGTLSIVTTTTDDSLLITTTEDSSSAAPVFTLKRNSSSVADGDYLGQIKFKGENDADQEVIYAKITGKILDASDGTEDGIIEIAHKKAGSNNISARFRSDSLQLINGTQLTVDGTSTFNGVTVNSSQTINMGSNRITSVADPSSAQDAATKAYVDSEVAGSSGDSVFASDADFAAVTTSATITEDLAAVTSSATTSLDLGTIAVQGIVVSTSIVDANVTSAKIASSAVTTAKIADDAVTTAKIPDDAITSVKLSGLTNSSSGVVSADGDGTFSVSAGGGLSNIVEDTTPQLGGDLASNGNNIAMADNDEIRVGSGNDIVIKWDATDGHITALGTLNIDGADGHEMAKFIDGGAVELYHNDVKKVETTTAGLSVTGNILPEANGTRDLGSTSLRWQNIYTSDLNLNNGVGNYTVVEGEEDLFLYNNKSGKVFKFALIEVDPSEATPKIEDLKNGSVR